MKTRNEIIRLSDCVYPKIVNETYIKSFLDYLKNCDMVDTDCIDVSELLN